MCLGMSPLQYWEEFMDHTILPHCRVHNPVFFLVKKIEWLAPRKNWDVDTTVRYSHRLTPSLRLKVVVFNPPIPELWMQEGVRIAILNDKLIVTFFTSSTSCIISLWLCISILVICNILLLYQWSKKQNDRFELPYCLIVVYALVRGLLVKNRKK